MSARNWSGFNELELRSSSVCVGESAVELGNVTVRISGHGILIVSAWQFSDSALVQLINEWACYEDEFAQRAQAVPFASAQLVASSYAAADVRPGALRVMSSYAEAQPGAGAFRVMSSYASNDLPLRAAARAPGDAVAMSRAEIDELFTAVRRSPPRGPALVPVSIVGSSAFDRPCAIVTDRANKLSIESASAITIVADDASAPWKIVDDEA